MWVHPASMANVTPQKITTFLMFEGNAEEAMTFYISLFDDAEVISISRYGADGPGAEGSVQHATFALAGQQYMAGSPLYLVDLRTSCFSWFGGDMPPDGPSSYTRARTDFNAWADAGASKD